MQLGQRTAFIGILVRVEHAGLDQPLSPTVENPVHVEVVLEVDARSHSLVMVGPGEQIVA